VGGPMAAAGLSQFAAKNIPLLLIYAVILGAIAFLTAIQSSFAGTFSTLLLFGAFIAAVVVAFETYQKGTPTGDIPVKTLVSAVVTAIIYIATWVMGQHTLTTDTGIAGGLLFLTYLEQELFPGATASSGGSTPTGGSGPPTGT